MPGTEADRGKVTYGFLVAVEQDADGIQWDIPSWIRVAMNELGLYAEVESLGEIDCYEALENSRGLDE